MRVLLIHNPKATTTSPALVDLIVGALASDCALEIAETKRRDHAGYLAAGAVEEGRDAVVVLGGDGTVNEVVQGLARTPVRLGVIPGGSTNVLARLLGLTGDPVTATGLLRSALRADRTRRIALGRAGTRWFCFNAGIGFDAEVVHRVEARAQLKRAVRQATFLYCGVQAWAGGFDRGTRLEAAGDDGTPVGDLRALIACNADPYTYLGRWPARLCPAADAEGGLDAFGLGTVALVPLLRVARAALSGRDPGRLRAASTWHDQEALTITADRPVPVQVDGDPLEPVTSLRLTVERDALDVLV